MLPESILCFITCITKLLYNYEKIIEYHHLIIAVSYLLLRSYQVEALLELNIIEVIDDPLSIKSCFDILTAEGLN